jgi:hypothetical protein
MAVSVTKKNIQHKTTRWLAYKELIKTLSQHLHGQTEENHKNLSGDSQYPGQDLNWTPESPDLLTINAICQTPSVTVLCKHGT